MATLKQLYNIAILRLEQKNFAGAESLLQQILLQTPADVFAKHQLAKISLEQNQVNRACDLLVDVSSTLPDDADVLIDLGRAYTLSNSGAKAIACLERACSIAPNETEAYRYLAEAYFAVGRFSEAEQSAERSTFLSPINAKAHSILGDALLEQGHVNQAIRAYDNSIELNPDSWKVYANKGIGNLRLGDVEQAKECLLLANALNPMHPSVALPLASVCIDLGQTDDATSILDKLQAMLPGDARVQTLIGDNALVQGNTGEAVAAFIKALSIEDQNINIQLKLAESLVKDGKVANAISFYDQILLKNDFVIPAYIEKAKLQLLNDAYSAGFESYMQLHQRLENKFGCPQWIDETLQNKTILLHSETSLDEFNVLIRFAKAVKERGAEVIVECTKPILSLVKQMECVDAVVELGDDLPHADYHAPLECLPVRLNIPVAEFTAAPYLIPRRELVSAWQQKFAGIKGLKVGLMWQKETDVNPNTYHSIPLNAFAPVFELENIHVISLAADAGSAQLDEFRYNDKLHRVGLENAFFEERIACISALDLFISADTLTAQVACAAGLPVWILLGKVTQWQYGLESAQTIWHPTAKLFRQSASGSFQDVVKNVTEALSILVS